MKITVRELRRIVYEAVSEAKKNAKRSKKDKEKDPGTSSRRGPDGHLEDPALDFSVPPAGGGRLKRQGTSIAPPVFTSEERVKKIVEDIVNEALRR